jgi:hypothetical protein
MDMPIIDKKPLITISCLLFVVVCNILAFIHFLKEKSLPTQDLKSKYNFFSTYTLYTFCQGVFVPVIVILSISSFKKYAIQKVGEKFHKINDIVFEFTTKRNKIHAIF